MQLNLNDMPYKNMSSMGDVYIEEFSPHILLLAAPWDDINFRF